MNYSRTKKAQLIEEIEALQEKVVELERAETERKQAEEALRRREQETRTIADNVPALVSYVDVDGRYRFVNKRYEEWFGIPRSEIVGKHYRQVLGEDTYEAIKDCVDAALSGQGVRYEEALPYATGGTRWVLADYVPDADDQGKVRGFFALVTDITERKRAEETLRRRNEESAILNAIAAVVSQSLDLEEVLDAALGKTLAALNADGGLIYLFDETSQTFAPVVHYGISQAVLQEVTGFKPGEGLSGHVAKSGRPLVTALGKNARDISPSGVREGLQSYAGVPIRSRGKVLGVMTLVSHQEDYFKPDHLGLLSHIGNQVGMAIENARLYEAEQAARQQLRDLANYLQTAREEERAYIAREVHDEFGQALTALKMDLSWLAKRLPKDAPSLAEKASIMSDLIDYTIHTVRHIATELRPGLLDDLGLVAAIEWQTQEFAERTEIDCELYTSHEEIALNPDLATAVFRIFQETLTNIARHAQATEVRIELEVSPDELTLAIRDNGQGITEGDIYNSRSLGLMGMRERARSWGGDVTFKGVAGQGTTVTVQIPRPNT